MRWRCVSFFFHGIVSTMHTNQMSSEYHLFRFVADVVEDNFICIQCHIVIHLSNDCIQKPDTLFLFQMFKALHRIYKVCIYAFNHKYFVIIWTSVAIQFISISLTVSTIHIKWHKSYRSNGALIITLCALCSYIECSNLLQFSRKTISTYSILNHL